MTVVYRQGGAEYEPGACFAPGCGQRVRPSMLMCRGHWFAVPHRIRGRVWRAFDGPGPLSDEWWAAARAARDSLGPPASAL